MTRFSHIMLIAGIAALSMTAGNAYSQCPFTPTVGPTGLILCPNEIDTLFTQTYDSYQWYKDGLPITGATSSSLIIDAYNYGGTYVHLAATLGGCTENSDTILVDGWAFLPPYVITYGTPVIVGGSGEAYFCSDDTVYLELGMPYELSIQWTNNGSPISGAHDDTLVVTTTGNYSVSGAPAVCPNYIANLGLSVPIYFLSPFVPGIVYSGGDLYTNDGSSWQWYLNGNPISGAVDSLLNNPGPGTYIVYATDSNGCWGESQPFIIDPMGTEPVNGAPLITLYPNPAHTTVQVIAGGEVPDELVLTDLSGKTILQRKNISQLDINGLSNGVYMINIRLGDEVFTRKLIIRN